VGDDDSSVTNSPSVAATEIQTISSSPFRLDRSDRANRLGAAPVRRHLIPPLAFPESLKGDCIPAGSRT